MSNTLTTVTIDAHPNSITIFNGWAKDKSLRPQIKTIHITSVTHGDVVVEGFEGLTKISISNNVHLNSLVVKNCPLLTKISFGPACIITTVNIKDCKLLNTLDIQSGCIMGDLSLTKLPVLSTLLPETGGLIKTCTVSEADSLTKYIKTQIASSTNKAKKLADRYEYAFNRISLDDKEVWTADPARQTPTDNIRHSVTSRLSHFGKVISNAANTAKEKATKAANSTKEALKE